MREMWFAVLVALSLAGTMPAQAQAPASPTPGSPLTGDAAKLLAITPDDRILGKKDAPVTIVEYASLTCPHCAHFSTTVLPEVQKKWIDTGKAKLVFRDYPLDEPALRAAMVARCAPPDRFFPFVETLFADQQQWVLSKDYKAALARIALLGGMSKTQFDDCLASKPGEDKVLQSRLAATQQLGVSSTPTFFINGVKFEGEPTVESFDAALGRAAGA